MPAPKKPVEHHQRPAPCLPGGFRPSAPARPAPLGEGDLFGEPFRLHRRSAAVPGPAPRPRPRRQSDRAAGGAGPGEGLGARPSSSPRSGCSSCAARWRRRRRTSRSPQPRSSRPTCCSARRGRWRPRGRWSRSSRCSTPRSCSRDGPGKMFRVAAAAGTNDGGRPTLFLADELHEWTGNKARVFLVISNSIAKRRDGLVLAISTAGSRGLRAAARAVRLRPSRSRRVRSTIRRSCSTGPRPTRPQSARRAGGAPTDGAAGQPARSRSSAPREHIERRWHEIPEHEWLRYFANRWVSGGGGIVAAGWCVARLRPHRRSGRSTAPIRGSVSTWREARHRRRGPWPVGRRSPGGPHRAWLPNGDTVDVASVEAAPPDLHRRYRLVEVAYDPAFFQRSAEALADDGLPMVEFPQSAPRMVPACQTAYERSVIGGSRTTARRCSPTR